MKSNVNNLIVFPCCGDQVATLSKDKLTTTELLHLLTDLSCFLLVRIVPQVYGPFARSFDKRFMEVKKLSKNNWW